MWTRAQLKTEAKARLKKFYWWAVLVSFIVMLFTGELGGNSYNSYNNNTDLSSILSSENDEDDYDSDTSDESWNDEDDYDSDTSNESWNDEDDYDSDTSDESWNDLISNIDMAMIYIVCGVVLIVFILAGLYMAFVGNMLHINENRFYLCSREYKASLDEIVYAFRNGFYLRSVKTMFVRDLKLFLWSLLLIIPGIIKSYEYRMLPSLLAENPQLETNRAFELSREMMRGQKLDTFILDLSFILWGLLGFITCGIGSIFIRPYIKATEMELYTFLKDSIKQRGITNDFELSGFSQNE